ncbi:MAG: hypothetical protein JSU06_16550 [Actinobacteria bacterium]|nr:hypothetical protein [Actinomycetota bacterium]
MGGDWATNPVLPLGRLGIEGKRRESAPLVFGGTPETARIPDLTFFGHVIAGFDRPSTIAWIHICPRWSPAIGDARLDLLLVCRDQQPLAVIRIVEVDQLQIGGASRDPRPSCIVMPSSP